MDDKKPKYLSGIVRPIQGNLEAVEPLKEALDKLSYELHDVKNAMVAFLSDEDLPMDKFRKKKALEVLSDLSATGTGLSALDWGIGGGQLEPSAAAGFVRNAMDRIVNPTLSALGSLKGEDAEIFKDVLAGSDKLRDKYSDAEALRNHVEQSTDVIRRMAGEITQSSAQGHASSM